MLRTDNLKSAMWADEVIKRHILPETSREAGATVYCTGRSTRERRSEYDRPETIEETAELVTAAGGVGIAVAVDHLEADEARVQHVRPDGRALGPIVDGAL
jgi:hypothetical protein